MVEFEEGVTCLDCGFEFEAENVIHSSLDAYGPLGDTFCPNCEWDNLMFHVPKEDKCRTE